MKVQKEESVLRERKKKIEYYVTHHKIKTEFENGQFKTACDLMFEMQQPEQPYIPMFYMDQLLSINKLIKHYILSE